MPKTSAGILLYRRIDGEIEVLLAHPGGPLYTKKDDGYWTIPKGEVDGNEDLLAAAVREFEEEIGTRPAGPFTELTPIKQKSGKRVHAWFCEGDCNITTLKSNTFTMEWPPKSGKLAAFPEIDRAQWFTLKLARQKINSAQAVLLDEVASKVT